LNDRREIKEEAVREKRIWVRLTRRCNNGCLFCLDTDSHDGTMVDRSVVEQQIRRGRDEGGQRLILSGGEPTIHPDFVSFLTLGRSLGYSWLQTVTNGRMFAYPQFARSALDAGLKEATFSMHGHNPDLHDRLVGVPGAFSQSLRGMRNLVGHAVLNVDVVLNRLNIPHLKDILEFFISLGITEFDLLHMVPFGRAWNENRSQLFYDPAEMAPHLRKAFALRRRKGIILWTNRLPAPFLEGAEDLIQDPHKLHDEVRGRLEMFSAWRDSNILPVCRDDRCPFCPMARYCDTLEHVLSSSGTPPDGRGQHSAWREPAWRGAGATDASVAAPPAAPEAERLQPRCPIEAPTLDVRSTAVRLWLPATRKNENRLAALTPESASGIGIQMIPREYLSEVLELDLTPQRTGEISAALRAPLAGLPPCLVPIPIPQGEPDPSAPPEPAQTLEACTAPDGKLDFPRFTDVFVLRYYYVKSLRCRGCALDGNCRGLHINTARAAGLGILRPFTAVPGSAPAGT